MAGYNEMRRWVETVKSLPHRSQWRYLTGDARYFVGQFRKHLLVRAKERPSKGDHNIIASPFSFALSDLLNRRRVTVSQAPPIDIAGRRKQADLAFTWLRERWVIEIKTQLTFDSLAAAALEGNAYLRKKEADRFPIVGLYHTFSQRNCADVAANTLRECGVKPDNLEICVVSRL